jgi:hypothetical protein
VPLKFRLKNSLYIINNNMNILNVINCQSTKKIKVINEARQCHIEVIILLSTILLIGAIFTNAHAILFSSLYIRQAHCYYFLPSKKEACNMHGTENKNKIKKKSSKTPKSLFYFHFS